MFKRFNKHRSAVQTKMTSFGKASNSSTGQAALILILIIAVALIFYAVSLNLGRVSANKTAVTIAANQGASLLASQMASYGQQLYKETLGGTFKKCQTNWLSFVILIVAIVLVVVTWGAAAQVGFAMGTMATTSFIAAVVGLALTTVSFVLQVTVIQPGLTERWNAMQKGAPLKDQFAESGLRTALISASNDPVQVIDRFDLDNDGVFGEASGQPLDKISRFAIYYDHRLNNHLRTRDTTFVSDFIDGLTEFVYDNPFGLGAGARDNWGIHDPATVADNCVYNPDIASPDYNVTLPSECNICCVPDDAVNESYDPTNPICISDPTNPICLTHVDVVPDCCDNGDPTTECGTRTTCSSAPLSPYLAGTPYHLNVYDRYYQSASNNDDTLPNYFESFLERLGKGDQHPHYYKDTSVDPVPITQLHRGALPPFYTADDATGVFPLFHYFDNWSVNLSAKNPAGSIANEAGEHCYWYDPNYHAGCAAHPYVTKLNTDNTLSLPENPGTLFYNTRNNVDGANNLGAVLRPDAIVSPDELATPINIVIPDNQCADQVYTHGIFKLGTDAYCQVGDDIVLPGTESHWPYYTHCAKHRDGGTLADPICSETTPQGDIVDYDCQCEEPSPVVIDKTLWHDDAIDEVVYGLYEFLDWSIDFLANTSGLQMMANTFEDWYADVAYYIETPGTCFICDDVSADARTYILDELRSRLNTFLGYMTTYRDTGFADDSVWCVPTQAFCPSCAAIGACPDATCDSSILAPASERLTFNVDGAGPQGQIEDVIACLNYNVEGFDFNTGDVFPEDTNMGNDYRWERCGQTCSRGDCFALPRPILPLLDRRSFGGNNTNANFLDHQAFRRCQHSCSLANCTPIAQGGLLPDVRTSNGVTPFIYPNPLVDPFDESVDCNPTNGRLRNASSWTNEIEGNIDMLRTPVDVDVELFLTCLDQCSQANCTPTDQGGPLPLLWVTDGTTPHTYPGAWTNCAGWGPGHVWYDAIAGNAADINPVCDLTDGNPWVRVNKWDHDLNLAANLADSDVAGTGWLFKVRHEALEARNLVEKFKQREVFLEDYEARLIDAIDTFRWGRDEVANFLNTTGADLVDARRTLADDPLGSDTGYPNRVIYGWRTDPPPDRMNLPITDPNYGKGYWHIVKVEVAVPQKCLGSCGGPGNPNETWPKVETYTKGFLGMTRCYELRNLTGIVKTRVTRWDEDRDPSRLTFPNGQPIWDFRSHHTQRGPRDFTSPLEGTCAPLPDVNLLTVTGDYKGAFIENETPAAGGGCWRRASGLLANGQTTETCAQYFGNSASDGFTFKFIPCPNDW